MIWRGTARRGAARRISERRDFVIVECGYVRNADRFSISFDQGERERGPVPLLLSKRNASYLREILLEIVGVQINVTVRHFTHTDAYCSRDTAEGAKNRK